MLQDDTVYRLRVTLRYVEPPIWRTLDVSAHLRLSDLHAALQIAMGWENAHLHQFVDGDQYYGVPDPDWRPDILDEARTPLYEMFRKTGDHLVYEYDFGDGWTHDIVLESIDPPAKTRGKMPRVVAGERACPPEDCGGVPGYDELVSALKDPDHPEREDLIARLDRPYDPARFDVAATNRRLRKQRA